MNCIQYTILKTAQSLLWPSGWVTPLNGSFSWLVFRSKCSVCSFSLTCLHRKQNASYALTFDVFQIHLRIRMQRWQIRVRITWISFWKIFTKEHEPYLTHLLPNVLRYSFTVWRDQTKLCINYFKSLLAVTRQVGVKPQFFQITQGVQPETTQNKSIWSLER